MEITDISNNTEHETRRSFSWDGAFLASDGFLAAEELSNMIEGGELQKIEEIESMEAKLFQEIKFSTTKSNVTNSSINSSPKKTDSLTKKVTGASGPQKVAPIKTPPKMSSKTNTNKAESLSKTLPAIKTKAKVGSVNNTNTRVSRTLPASPVSPRSPPGSSSSPFGVGQRSKVSGSTPRRYSVINERPSTINVRRNVDQKASKRGVSLVPRTLSTMSLKVKPTPVNSHSSSPSSSTTPRLSESSSRGVKSSNVPQISKPALKNHPTKQPAKTAATTNTGLKPNSPKATTPKKQSSPKAKASSPENIFIISPELLDLQGKIRALKMEIDMHKKDRFNKMAGAVRVEVT
ncbi:uncharacterized protein LOC143539947 [Bidens hawaiensis]|uniref:uncharacterized protein LOC143539947 n=1 Tax=Bidens hawaiensis TaxID=980011 RepID=UPI004049C2A6